MHIRKATPSDARRISYLIKKNTENVLENRYSESQIRIWKKANTPKAIERQMESRIIFCAFHGQKLVGTIALSKNEVLGLYVSYTKRKAGIGGQLLQFVEEYARSTGIEELVLTATPSGLPFYQSKGYTPLQAVTVDIMGIAFEETKMHKRI